MAEQPKYQTEWDREIFYSPAGEELQPVYKRTVDKDGKTIVKEVKKTNIYEKIQAAHEDTKVYNILEKYIATGDTSLLNKEPTSLFIDTTILPQNEMELHQITIEAEDTFRKLDRKIKEEFNNDVNQFKAAVLNGTLDNRLEKFRPKKNEEKTTEATQQTTNQGVDLNE